MIRFTVTCFFCFILCTFSNALGQSESGSGDREVGAAFATRSPVIAKNGIAATSHPLATQVALDILKQGGNAIDASIGANAILGLIEPASCGVGGDLFAIVWNAESQKLFGLNASGRSSRSFSYEDMKSAIGDRQSIPSRGPLSVTVPGVVDGWFELHNRFGSLPMEKILEPSIHYSVEGVPVPQIIAHRWNNSITRVEESLDYITEIENFRNTFSIDGRSPYEGEIFRNPDLGRTYSMIAEGGRNAFYRGQIADIIDEYGQRVGIPIRKEDLETHTSTWVEPVSINYRGYDIYQLPPNGQGIAALQMLNILEGFDLKKMGHNSADYLHVHVEAKKLAYEDRARHYADPDFYDVPIDRLLSKEYAEKRRQLIDMDRALESIDASTQSMRKGGTVYLTVADDQGNIVSLIQSDHLDFASGLIPDGLGFPLQSRGASFSMDPNHPNVYEPNKRPFHTIIPSFIMKNGEPYISFGVMGGGQQPQAHAQVVTNLIDFGMNIQEAGDAARYAHSGSSTPTGGIMSDGGTLSLESSIPIHVRRILERRGHKLSFYAFYGGYQAILWDKKYGVYHGASEMRKDGQAAGY